MKRIYLLFLLIFIFHLAQGQTLKRATGGLGQYKDEIWWLDFTNVEIPSGSSVTQTYNIENKYTLVVTIDNILFGGTLDNNTPLSSQRIIGYASGTYGGDGLVKLYNIDVTNNGANVSDRNKNTLFNSISLKYDGDYTGNGSEASANFRIRAYAYLNNQLDPMDVGLIFADAETNEPDNTLVYEEYSQGTTNGSQWQFLETGLFDLNGEQKVIISNNGLTAQTICGFNGFNWSAGNSILMYTNKTKTTSIDPLLVNMEFKGGGRSATAIGFMLTASEMGDAPASYGSPVNLMPFTVLGGTPSSDNTYYISANGLLGGTPILTTGTIGFSNLPRLGSIAGDPDTFTIIPNTLANLDNNDGLNDEDALSTPIMLTTRMTQYTATFNSFTGTNQDAYINAWLDTNQNGTFDATEFKSQTITSSGLLNFTWNNLELKTGTTYLRLRVQSNVIGNPTGSSDIKIGGEIEDYKVDITTFITGNIYNDANGLFGIPFNTVDGTPISSINGQPLYVSLMNGANLVAQTPIQAGGFF